MSESRIQRIKVSPYPINAVILGLAQPQQGKIVKLTTIGFLIELPTYAFVVGDKYDVMFTLPVVGADFKEPVVVIKTYDQFKGKTSAHADIYRLYEFHFRSMSNHSKIAIENFLRQIGQIK